MRFTFFCKFKIRKSVRRVCVRFCVCARYMCACVNMMMQSTISRAAFLCFFLGLLFGLSLSVVWPRWSLEQKQREEKRNLSSLCVISLSPARKKQKTKKKTQKDVKKSRRERKKREEKRREREENALENRAQTKKKPLRT